ncbi:aminopeptidase [uncultured Akkermansia sp.]|uniref:aminopeptidase n=1 Tax=uncultured Akkermansia sp. TaxID=512294 RepID=UPI00261C75D1|nr:aminopeptidase [uncultured Akkermansia sp.]
MRDPRFQALAAQLAGYSTSLRPGDRVLLELTDIPEEMGIALIREVRKAGAMPFLRLNQSRLNREMLSGATEEQYGIIGRHRLAEMEDMDAFIEIRGGGNAFELSSVPQENMTAAMKALNPVSQRRIRHTRWCGLRWPSGGMAQQAAMSTEEFEDFYFHTCLMDYAALRPAMRTLAAMMEKAEYVKITGPGTDISFSIKGLPAIPCAGECNLPDGEVFTAPVIDSANGHIAFNTPSLFQGIPFDNIRLTLENGLIVHAEAGEKTGELNAILDTDPGARRLGEFAFGVNPAITRPMRNILFDEKISGSFHLTPGQAYHVADNGNQSRIHWDMVCLQTETAGGGDIYLDGKLVRRNGLFTLPELTILNPSQS